MKFDIKNNLLNSKNEKTLLKVLSAALQAADPRKAVSSVLDFDGKNLRVSGMEKKFPVNRRVHLIGTGKASIPMACGVANALGENISSGLIITKSNLEQPTRACQSKLRSSRETIPSLEKIHCVPQKS